MGQTLSEPVTEKHTCFDEDDTLIYGCSEMQGWRLSMEDAHTTVLNLDGKLGDDKTSFFAVYDGHGGSAVAEFSGRTLHKTLIELPEYKRGEYPAALKRAFLKTDELLQASPQYASDPSGCTAVAALLVKTPKTSEEKASEQPQPGKPDKVARRIYVANAGDSRCVLSVAGEAKPMSYDHKPTNPGENARIVAAGGFVEFGRVNGNLALSRSIGDAPDFKGNPDLPPERQIVTADPDIEVHDVNGDEEFLILACDGIWDCLSNQQAVNYVRRGLAQGKEPKVLCEEIMDKCLAPASDVGGIGCDNMTIEVVALLGGRTKSEYNAWIKHRVENQVGYATPETIPEVFRSRGGTGLGPEGVEDEDDEEDDDEKEEEEEERITLGGSGGPSSLLFSALADGMQGQEEGQQDDSLRLPGALAQALSSAGIVLGTPEDGEPQAQIVDSDDELEHAYSEGEARLTKDQNSEQPTSQSESKQGGETPPLVTSPKPLDTPGKGSS